MLFQASEDSHFALSQKNNTPDPSLMTRAGRVDTIDVIDAIELTTSDPLPLEALPDRFVKPSP